MRGAVNYHRLIIPHINLKKQNPEIEITQGVDQMQLFGSGVLEKIDMVVFSRCIYFENLEHVVKIIKGCNVRVVLDVDDYWHLDDHHILKGTDHADMIEQVKTSIRIADLVTTTNKRLLKKIRPFNKRVHILPNAIDTDEEAWQYSGIRSKGKLKVGYFGGQTHREDLLSTNLHFKKLKIDCFVEDFKDFMPVI